MKILLSIVVCFCFVLISYSFHEQIQNPEKSYFIHKTKRPFVKKGDREYLKKKGVEYFNKNHLPTVDEKIRIAQQKEKTGNLKGAFYDYNLALLIDPVNPELLYNIGNLKFQMEDFADAITDFDNAIVNDSLSVELFYSRGNAKFELKNYSEAIEDFTHAIQLDSTDRLSFFNRGISYINAGEKESSCKDLELAKKYNDSEAQIIIKEICR